MKTIILFLLAAFIMSCTASRQTHIDPYAAHYKAIKHHSHYQYKISGVCKPKGFLNFNR